MNKKEKELNAIKKVSYYPYYPYSREEKLSDWQSDLMEKIAELKAANEDWPHMVVKWIDDNYIVYDNNIIKKDIEMGIEEKMNKVFQTAWEQKIDLKGIVLDKKHKKDISKISSYMGEASVIENDLSHMITIIYQ